MMIKKNIIILLAIITIGYGFGFPFCLPAVAIPAFPGAEGLGSNTAGGRGGAVIHVTNLNDSGAGSLRAAVTASGPRLVVFDVSGNIPLNSTIMIKNPNITIAGQTSPGGIAVSGKPFQVATHDVIIRHMRFRHGGYNYDSSNDSDGDSFNIWGPAWNGGNPVYNIMIDHCSFTWGTDETFSASGGSTAVTIQNCLAGCGLDHAKSATVSHSKSFSITGKYGNNTEVTLYRNYIATSSDRNPLMWNPFGNVSGATVQASFTMLVDARNNVLYNWYHGNRPMVGGWRNSVNWIENWSKEGPLSTRFDAMIARGYESPAPYPILYIRNSHGINKTGAEFADGDPAEWAVSDNYNSTFAPIGWKRSTEFPVRIIPKTEKMTSALAASIVASAGATVPVIDSVDQAIINSYATGTGKYPDTVKYPNDWPIYSTPAPPADTDNDGMPDAWEKSKGLNPNSADSNNYFLDSNYTNIEIYVNELAGDYTPTGVLPFIKTILLID